MMRTLFWWRLRHVTETAYRLLLRRWQSLLVVLLLLSPRDMPVLQQLAILAHPVLVLTAPGPPGPVLTDWLLLLALALAWAHAQGEVLAGGAPWSFARTLPIAPRSLRRVDLAVLAVCDLPLFLPFLAALAVLPPGPAVQRVLQAPAIIVAVSQVPLVQWLAPRRPVLAVLAVALQLAGLWLLAAGFSPAPFLAACGAATFLALRLADRPAPPREGGRWTNLVRPWPLPAGARPWIRLAYIDLRALADPRRLLRHLSLAACVLLPLLLRDELRSLDVRSPVVTTAVVLTLIPLVFGVSNLAFELRRLHEPMRAFHASLGIDARLLRTVDAAVLLAVFLPCLVPLVASAWQESGSARVLAIVPLGALALLACTALNFRGDRGVVLPKALACAAAVAGALIAILP